MSTRKILALTPTMQAALHHVLKGWLEDRVGTDSPHLTRAAEAISRQLRDGLTPQEAVLAAEALGRVLAALPQVKERGR